MTMQRVSVDWKERIRRVRILANLIAEDISQELERPLTPYEHLKANKSSMRLLSQRGLHKASAEQWEFSLQMIRAYYVSKGVL